MFSQEKFGERLKEVRRFHGEKQSELGEIIGIGKAQVSEMESGKKVPRLRNLP